MYSVFYDPPENTILSSVLWIENSIAPVERLQKKLPFLFFLSIFPYKKYR